MFTRRFVLLVTLLLFLALLFFAWHIRGAYLVLPANVMKPIPVAPYSMWRDFTSPDRHYSVRFPLFPQQATDSVRDPTTKQLRVYDMNVAEQDDGTSYVVTRITFSGGPTQGLGVYRDEVLTSNPNSQLKSEQTGTFFGREDLDFIFEGDNGITSCRLFFVGQTLYLLMVISKPETYSPDHVSYFFNSLRVLSP